MPKWREAGLPLETGEPQFQRRELADKAYAPKLSQKDVVCKAKMDLISGAIGYLYLFLGRYWFFKLKRVKGNSHDIEYRFLFSERIKIPDMKYKDLENTLDRKIRLLIFLE